MNGAIKIYTTARCVAAQNLVDDANQDRVQESCPYSVSAVERNPESHKESPF